MSHPLLTIIIINVSNNYNLIHSLILKANRFW